MSINKIKLIKAEIERLEESLPWGSCASQISMECNCKNEAYNEVLSYIDSLSDTEKDFGIKEELVSENTQFAQMADKYEQQVLIGEYQMKESVAHHCRLSYYLGLKDGAQWQKQQDQSTIELAEDHAMLAGMEKMKQKPAWSKEDNEMFDKIRSIIEKYAFSESAVDVNGDLCEKEYIDADNWLKSLKGRTQPKQEWSEEDENYLNTTIAYLKDANEFKKTAEKCITWLKSLRPQNT